MKGYYKKAVYSVLLLCITIYFTFGSLYYSSPFRPDGGFSADSVAVTLKTISMEPHSMEHPEARGRVKEYLVSRLEKYGAEVSVLRYDSVPDKVAGLTSVSDVYAVLEPDGVEPESYLMFVAHYDSRFAQDVKGDTVYSRGAADDGYGLGVILELVRTSLMFSDEWKNGLKVLFTDAEETDLTGMRMAWEKDRGIFDKVAFLCNVEARGVKGPALLFETSRGNDRLLDLYSEASCPYAYSLTASVYERMPNFTDFSVVKDDIPGLNISVIDNLKYYHTDKDRYENISLRSIRHYGSQLYPVMRKFLTDDIYSDVRFFRSEKDMVYFTLPVAGMFRFTEKGWIVANAVVMLLALWAFVAYSRLYAGWKNFWILSAKLLCFAVGSAVAGTLAAYLLALANGLDYEPLSLKYVSYDNLFIVLAVILQILSYVYLFRERRGHEMVNPVLFMLSVMAFAMFLVFRENFFFLLPLFFYSLALVLFCFTGKRIWFYACMFFMLLFAISFYYIFITALTIGSLGIMLFATSFVTAPVISSLRFIFCSSRYID